MLVAKSWLSFGKEEREMSRIGRMPIAIPNGVEVKVDSNNLVTVTGKLGTLSREVDKLIKVEVKDNEVIVTRPNDSNDCKAKHGLYRMLIANMIKGVSEGFSKSLVINGVGYKVQKQGNKIVLNVGFSHPVEVQEVPGITLECPDATTIVVKGISNETVGQFTAKIRGIRPVEPYHAYGIRYNDEVVIKKVGKVSGKK
jgi:large subunit ribosomal protein L6